MIRRAESIVVGRHGDQMRRKRRRGAVGAARGLISWFEQQRGERRRVKSSEVYDIKVRGTERRGENKRWEESGGRSVISRE
jgi:hypothetical protein